ncbi:MAG: DUF3467 domain-containing protein [candidate division Zixibacteria bacterium]|nr:DUF3467 domain-containing protein [candidate division Zixibacteria bacterium]
MNKPPQQQIKVQLDDKEAEGIYANLAMINHNPSEIIIDFARVMPPTLKARVLSRIIMTPMHAKLLQKVLTSTIEQFEKAFGEIKLQGLPDHVSKPIGFQAADNTEEEK